MRAHEVAVASGAQWLNEALGHDWPDFIDRATLDLDSPGDCVLGQQFEGGYGRVVYGDGDYYGFDWAVTHGFTTAPGGSMRGLQREWEKYLDEYELATA